MFVFLNDCQAKLEDGELVFYFPYTTNAYALVPHLLCPYDQAEFCLVCLLGIYPMLRSRRTHMSGSHLAGGRIEAAQPLSYLFQWQSRSGKLIKLITQTSKHQERECEGTDEFSLHSKLHLPLVLMESVQSADENRRGALAVGIKAWREIGTWEIIGEGLILWAGGVWESLLSYLRQ